MTDLHLDQVTKKIVVRQEKRDIKIKRINRNLQVNQVGRRGPTGLEGPQGDVGPEGPPGPPGEDGLVISVEAGALIAVDDTDPAHPIVSSTVTKAALGLNNVDNTSDVNKPVSTAQQTALDAKQDLDPDLTAIAGLSSASSGAIVSDGSGWIKKTYAQFKTALGLVKADVGLGNADNTSDANKPVSTAQAAADTTVASNAAAALSSHEADTTNVHGITNTALLETTSGAQSKADAKVADAINNGVTTIAPSQNAVFDALALKANSSDVPSTIVESVVAGSNVTVDDSDPANPIVSSSGSGGIAESLVIAYAVAL